MSCSPRVPLPLAFAVVCVHEDAGSSSDRLTISRAMCDLLDFHSSSSGVRRRVRRRRRCAVSGGAAVVDVNQLPDGEEILVVRLDGTRDDN